MRKRIGFAFAVLASVALAACAPVAGGGPAESPTPSGAPSSLTPRPLDTGQLPLNSQDPDAATVDGYSARQVWDLCVATLRQAYPGQGLDERFEASAITVLDSATAPHNARLQVTVKRSSESPPLRCFVAGAASSPAVVGTSNSG
ncbi:hypothetical protein [Lacisediminihabitans profunda]|uniref:Lipoprotein n=1 Tax=Lacisediminihabitans profunda TaxID=2594790 RepID=A0A5C8UMV5_9MICO|nr:hypothetical protein [Lacisediminihabitans profunda]TXN28810.1 hypothetical protein FVP33_16610 [Lacisediminihabitans profunda]